MTCLYNSVKYRGKREKKWRGGRKERNKETKKERKKGKRGIQYTGRKRRKRKKMRKRRKKTKNSNRKKDSNNNKKAKRKRVDSHFPSVALRARSCFVSCPAEFCGCTDSVTCYTHKPLNLQKEGTKFSGQLDSLELEQEIEFDTLLLIQRKRYSFPYDYLWAAVNEWQNEHLDEVLLTVL